MKAEIIMKMLEENVENSFEIKGKRGNDILLTAIIPGTKLFDANKHRVSFFDSDSGVELEIWFTPDVIVNNKGFSSNDYSVKLIEGYHELSMTIDDEIKNKNNEYNFNNKLYIMA